ncbi:MAG: hypothetical protein ACRDH2_08695 [Anaerolineales bacterium]
MTLEKADTNTFVSNTARRRLVTLPIPLNSGAFGDRFGANGFAHGDQLRYELFTRDIFECGSFLPRARHQLCCSLSPFSPLLFQALGQFNHKRQVLFWQANYLANGFSYQAVCAYIQAHH